MSDNKLKVIPLGGLEGIGKNCTLFEYNEKIIIVDCGIMFPTEEMPGIDLLIPDFSYIKKNRDKVVAILITHGHEDHIGAIPFLLQEINPPIYATKLTVGLIQSRLSERPPPEEPNLHVIQPKDIVKIDDFTVEFIRVNHSIVDSVALAITTPIGTIIHTGDFKIDFSAIDGEVTDIHKFADYGEKGVLLLLSDSTNAERDGFTKSESTLDNKFTDIFSTAKGRIIVTTFASNINRIQQVLDIAQKYNKSVVISGYSMQKNIEISKELGYLNIKDNLIVSIEESKKLPHKKLVIIGTGTQGEPMSALSRMARGTHKHFFIQEGDTVAITASVIPGNERYITNVINTLMKLGANVLYDREADIHVSGHGSIKELKLMISITKPKFFMPVHGEYKHLKAHTKIAESLNIKPSRILIGQNGDILELTNNSFKKIESIKLAQIYVDGPETGNMESSIIKDRNIMLANGVIIINAVISGKKLVKGIEIDSKGFSDNPDFKVLPDELDIRIKNMLVDNSSITNIEFSIKKTISNYIYKTTRRNPLLISNIIEV